MNLVRIMRYFSALVPKFTFSQPLSQIDISAKTLRDDMFPRLPVLFAGGVTALPDVEYSNLIGYRPLLMDLYFPKAKGIHPLVIWLHGGGWSRGDSRGNGNITNFPATLATLAARGYVVASVNYRLSSEAKFPAQIQDVNAAIGYLKINSARYGVDPNRVLLWGGSAGGHLAALAALTCSVADYSPQPSTGRLGRKEALSATGPDVSSCVQGAVIWYGAFDLASLDGDNAKALMGCSCAEKMALASPINRVNGGAPPMFFVHGTDDTDIPVKQAHLMEARLKAAGNSVQVLYLQDVDHGFIGETPNATRDANRMALQATFNFIDKTFAK
jgi:acetyl esterase/lipase